jgi:hypothetical protein
MSAQQKQEKKAKTRARTEGPASQDRQGGSREARQAVSLILEVLAGMIGPGDAARALGLSTARYYVIESRAIGAMVAACEPRGRGQVKTAAREIEVLRKEHARVQRECARYQALARAAQRTVGVALPRKDKASKGKKRRPTVRGLKLARDLKAGPAREPGEEPAGQKETKETAAAS